MRNYTEQLKKYWQSKDLSFIATFKKINDNAGFFNHFVNPVSLMQLYYPESDEIEILDKRVSFYYGKAKDLRDGLFYKVELDHSDKPNGKNNPYSLRIKNISELNQNKVKELFEKNKKTAHIKYYGRYHKEGDRFASFDNVMFVESGDILMNQGESIRVFVSPKIDLTEGKYYTFSIKENEGKLPNAIPNSIKESKLNPYQEYIRLRFERLNNPEANKMIANLMREIGKGMYSSKQRMIFELLQNADDAPGKEKVEFHIDINGDYFFVMHDGAPFNKDDVEAITSAAESTKRSDSKKTGYKGIGFKSVFTDSTEVWLKSGGYQFAFLRNSPLFEDFDKFYFSSERYKKYPDLLKEDRLKYRNQKLRFNGSTDIPWQVIPIWKDKLPKEFNDSNYNNFNNPVQFALKLGKNNIEEYKAAIDSITNRPQFLLFLRNTSKFRSPKNGVTVTRIDNGDVIEIEKSKSVLVNNKRTQKKDTFHYTKQSFGNIPITDDAFTELNIRLKKQSKINDYNEVTYFFTDLTGNRIETIPPKLASATETEIAFGISIDNNRISPEKDYINGLSKYSSLFTYLPMEDTRFQLPFLVNADFVPSSDRQSIQGDNPWNKYIMIRVAEKHVKTLSNYAYEFLTDNAKYSTYLSLLLKELIPEDETAQQIIDSYNQTYLEQLKIQPIIVNDANQTQLISDTILDTSGLTDLFGNDIFYEIIDTSKRLPHQNLESSYLKNYDYLEIEIVDLVKMAKFITPEIAGRLGEIIAEKSLYNKPELLKWLNKLVTHIPKSFGNIPFIVHNNSLYSIDGLLKEPEAWLINSRTANYESIFNGMGYNTINLNLSEYPNINAYLLELEGYLNDKTLAYERIASNQSLSRTDITLKLNLIDFLQNSEFMLGIGETKYFGELKLFIDENGESRPLWQLISRQEEINISSIQQFRVADNEFIQFPETLRKELIAKEQIFISFILNEDLFNSWSQQFDADNINTYVDDLKSIYAWGVNKNSISSAEWASIPWLFIDNDSRFLTADKVYWSGAFNNMQPENYETIKSIFHKAKLKTLPLKKCGDIILQFKLKTDNILDFNWTNIKNIETLRANIFLDWLEEDGSFSDFFEEYTLEKSGSGQWNISKIKDIQIFDGSEKEYKAYIQSLEVLNAQFTELDEALHSNTRSKIGLLQGDKLLKAIIESKAFDQNLAKLLPSTLPWELLNNFVSNISEFNIKTGITYDSYSPEHIIIYHLIKLVEDINAIPKELQICIDNLREKIKVNNNPLSDYDLSDRIQFGKGDNKKVLSLSNVVNEYKGESNVLDELIESFTSIKEKAKLRKVIFRTRQMQLSEICSKIESEKNTYYSVHQVVFQLLYKSYIGQRQWLKKRFDDYWKEQENEMQLQSTYKAFLDVLLEIDYTDLSDFQFHGFILTNCVDKSYAIESEIIPSWLEEWINIDQTNRVAFISKLGYNGLDSPIVKLRESTIAENYDSVNVTRHYANAKSNPQLTWNTIEWLSKHNSKIITRNIELIKLINNDTTLSNELMSVIIPVIELIASNGKKTYTLQNVPTNSDILLLGDDEEFSLDIFKALKNETNLIVDNSCGNKKTHFNVNKIQLIEKVDIEQLVQNSKLWDEPFYKKWEFYDSYPIYIYNGNEIPYERVFNGITVNQFTRDLKVENNGRFYVSSILKQDILNNLPSSFPNEKLSNLKEWHYQTLQDESLLDDNPYEENYNEDFDRMIQDRFGISSERQRDENNNARKLALYFLEDEGYNLKEGSIKNEYSALYNIIDPNGNYVNIIVRSAKGGLLYLDKDHWDMLEDDLMQLVVIYPGNTPRIFKNRIELLEEELVKKVIFRIPNNKNVKDIDNLFDILSEDSHVLLVTGEKMRESLFSDLRSKGDIKQENDVAIAGEDFKF